MKKIILILIIVIICVILYNKINSKQQTNNQQIYEWTTCRSVDSAIIIWHYNCDGKKDGLDTNKKCRNKY